MRVSVIVPLYNKASHIQRCLESIAAQSFSDFEVIVVNDGSTDDSAKIAASFKDPRFRVISQSNAGPGAARNWGVETAAGELLAFLDGDDEWMPEYLEHSVKALDEAGLGVACVSSGYIEFPSGRNPEPMWRRRELTEGIFQTVTDTKALLLVYVLAYMSCWNTVIRADVFRQLGGFYGRTRALYAEDSWLWLQVLLNYPVLIRFEPLTRFHREASELSANYRSVRPVEPFLLEPEPIEGTCPADLRELLRQVLAIRAMKTACVLGYWGDWKRANQLRDRFTQASDYRLPYFLASSVCSTPLGGILGRVHRSLPHS